MNIDMIESSELTSSFLKFTGGSDLPLTTHGHNEKRSGSLCLDDLDCDVQTKIHRLMKNSALIGNGFAELFEGGLDKFDGDHSKCDYALILAASKSGFTPDQCDQVLRASGLYRKKWDDIRGSTTYGWQTIDRVFANTSKEDVDEPQESENLCLSDFVPQYIPGGMAPREFVGPKVAAGAHLFPKNALSAMVAIGGGAKTSSIISLAAHIAAGRYWKGCPLKASKVMLFAVEETKDELNRKFSAIVAEWSEHDRERAISNLRLLSMHGFDARLIKNEYVGITPTEWPNRIVDLAAEFGLDGDGLIILDHYQGFANGDLNTSDTATAMCREGNYIVSKTGAAVVFTAHIPKAQIGSKDFTQGMASGSFAFENAMRQVVVLLPMPDDEAKKFGVVSEQKQFIKLGFTKNSYGTTDAECWLRKIHVPTYHTIKVEPVDLLVPIPVSRQSANDKLSEAIIRFIESKPYATKNMLDRDSGKDGKFGASKDKCRDVLKGLIDAGIIHSHRITDSERIEIGIPKQVTEVLRVS